MTSEEKLKELKEVLQYTYEYGNNNPDVSLEEMMKEITEKLKSLF